MRSLPLNSLILGSTIIKENSEDIKLPASKDSQAYLAKSGTFQNSASNILFKTNTSIKVDAPNKKFAFEVSCESMLTLKSRIVGHILPSNSVFSFFAIQQQIASLNKKVSICVSINHKFYMLYFLYLFNANLT